MGIHYQCVGPHTHCIYVGLCHPLTSNIVRRIQTRQPKTLDRSVNYPKQIEKVFDKNRRDPLVTKQFCGRPCCVVSTPTSSAFGNYCTRRRGSRRSSSTHTLIARRSVKPMSSDNTTNSGGGGSSSSNSTSSNANAPDAAAGKPAVTTTTTAPGVVSVQSPDVIRLMLQFMKEHNLVDSMKALEKESGVTLNSVHQPCHSFRSLVKLSKMPVL